MSIKGSPYARFRRALATGNIHTIRGAAADLPHVGLDDALRIVFVVRDDADLFERASIRWLGRLCLEYPVGLEDVEAAMAALKLLPSQPVRGRAALEALGHRLGVLRKSRDED